MKKAVLPPWLLATRASRCDRARTRTSSDIQMVHQQTVAEKHIANGQALLTRVRWKIAMFVVVVSLVFVGLDIVCKMWASKHHHKVESCQWSSDVAIVLPIWSVLMYGRIALVSTAPPADDLHISRLVVVADIGFLSYSFAGGFYWSHDNVTNHSQDIDHMCTFAYVTFTLGMLLTLCCSSARDMQKWLWRFVQMAVLFDFVILVFEQILVAYRCGHPHQYVMWAPGPLILLCTMWNPTWRQHCHVRVSRTLECWSERRAAASIASLVGSCSAREVLVQAQERFRSVQLADLTLDDFRDNAPNPDLFLRSSPGELGEVDAFFSHSWHDCAEAKWRAMQQWRAAFVLEHGREPKVWIDMCCIDQCNIECDLRCLPVFLSGCQKFVVFVGQTYLSRLWCIVEIFTFVQMGRSIDNIEVQVVLPEGCGQEDAGFARLSFENFDARECDCFLAKDKAKMLSIILGAFGKLSSFNKEVTSIFRQVGFHVTSPSSINEAVVSSLSSGDIV